VRLKLTQRTGTAGLDGSPSRLSAAGVSVRFGGLLALEDVTLVLERGEILGLMGPNGAGKTTLLNVLSAYQPPSAGTVTCGSTELHRRPPHLAARCGVSRTFQSARLFGGLSVFENVALGALGHGHSVHASHRVAEELLGECDLLERAGDRAGSLPYGSQRVVGIARALACGPGFLLLDEPATGLNEEEGRRLVSFLAAIRDRHGCGMLIVEHDVHLIMTLSDRIQVLDYGKTLAVGPPATIQRDPAVAEAYLGTHGGELVARR
jgi:ABC-type branched-subunit amino acid transport system ATPase component